MMICLLLSLFDCVVVDMTVVQSSACVCASALVEQIRLCDFEIIAGSPYHFPEEIPHG